MSKKFGMDDGVQTSYEKKRGDAIKKKLCLSKIESKKRNIMVGLLLKDVVKL